jgi:hypothetical protein
MRPMWILLLLMPFFASCSNSSTALRNPATGQTALCAYSGWGWLGAPMAASMYADCKTKWQKLGYVKEGDLSPTASAPAASVVPAPAQSERPPAARQPDVPSSTAAPSVSSVPSPTQSQPPAVAARQTDVAAPSLAPSSSGPKPERRQSVTEQPSWILGSWQTVEGKSGMVDGIGRFEFRRDGTDLKWKMRRAGWFSGVRTTQEASGTVSKISETTAELSGKYHSSNLGVVGQPVRHSFTRDGDRLQGYETAEDGTQSVWTWQRVR